MDAPMRLAIALALALAGACNKDSQPGQDTADQLAQAREMYNAKCARCHGFDGDGNGPFADSLTPRPHKYTDPAWQASVTDDQIKEIILRGGLAMGKSPAMPGIRSLKHQPELLEGLVKLIRSFGKPGAK
jgi:mono/diheme cytochrome c family protein